MLRSLLSSRGRLIVQVPNVEAWQCRLLGRRWGGYDPPRHLLNYSATTLRRTLAENGFRVLRENHFSLRDNPTTLANSLAPALYPPARPARGTEGRADWLANLAYLGLVLVVLPFTLVESAWGRGAAVMVEAEVS